VLFWGYDTFCGEADKGGGGTFGSLLAFCTIVCIIDFPLGLGKINASCRSTANTMNAMGRRGQELLGVVQADSDLNVFKKDFGNLSNSIALRGPAARSQLQYPDMKRTYPRHPGIWVYPTPVISPPPARARARFIRFLHRLKRSQSLSPRSSALAVLVTASNKYPCSRVHHRRSSEGPTR